METASFTGFIKTLAYIVLFWYLLKFLFRIFAPVLMRGAMNKVQQKMQDQMNSQFGQQNTYKNQNTNSQKSNTKQMPTEKKKVGEYVDFEEID